MFKFSTEGTKIEISSYHKGTYRRLILTEKRLPKMAGIKTN